MARPQQSQYGISRPQQSQSVQFDDALSSLSPSSPQFSQSQQFSGGAMMDPHSPKVYKHISIHVAPRDEFEEEMPMKRVIRPMEKPNKIVNIIFVKAPSHSSSGQTEIILPAQAETRTVVYVLLKRPSGNDANVKIRQPKPTKPSKPAVFFIKYGQGQQSGQVGGGSIDDIAQNTIPTTTGSQSQSGGQSGQSGGGGYE